jgi:hypothetical protein
MGGYRGLGRSDAMTDDEPKSFSMEEAMQAIRDALGHRESLKPQSCNNQLRRELIPNLPRDDDFFVKRLAGIEEKKAHDADTERLCQTIPLITDCIKKMWLAGLKQKDISVLLRQAADELDKAKTDAS